MSGKIFANSANVIQDQARVLFDYYKSAAEAIVTEEERIEKEIKSLRDYEGKISIELNKQNLAMKAGFIAGLILLVAGIIFTVLSKPVALGLVGDFLGVASLIYGFVSMSKAKQSTSEIAICEKKIAAFEKEFSEIFRDYKVTKLGVGYIPVAEQIPFENKSFLIDFTGHSSEETFKLQTISDGELFSEKINDMDEMIKEAPIVEESNETEVVDTGEYSKSIQKVVLNDYFGRLDRNLRTVSYCLGDLDITTVSLPVIMPNSGYANYLTEFATDSPMTNFIIKPFETDKYKEEVQHFRELNDLKKSLERHSVQFEEALKNLMNNVAVSIQAITTLKIASSNRLVQQSNKLLFRILKSAYNHYSPLLEAEEIERIRNEAFDFSESVESYQHFQLKKSSLVRFDAINEVWVAEDGSKTMFPFAVHQIHEEIIAPIVSNLMEENRIERLKIYNNIKDQKISYLNKWHQDTEDFYGRNRAEANDLINIMRSTLSEYVAAYNTLAALETTEKSMVNNSSLDSTVVHSQSNSGEVLAAFEAKSKEFQSIQKEFSDYMDRLKEDIEAKALKFEYIEYYEASLTDSYPKEMSVATNNMMDVEERRKPLLAVNPLYAEQSKLPPEPSIEELAEEHLSINLTKVAERSLNELNDPATYQEVDTNLEFRPHKKTLQEIVDEKMAKFEEAIQSGSENEVQHPSDESNHGESDEIVGTPEDDEVEAPDEQDQSDQEDEEDLVEVYEAEDEAEANEIMELLENNGLEVFFEESEGESNQVIIISVREADVDKAINLIESKDE